MLTLLRNKQARSVLFQILALAGVSGLVAFFAVQVQLNLKALGLELGFDFLSFPANYDINQTLIEYSSRDTHLRATIVGLINTALIAGCGIVLATILGFIIGVMRLSHNYLISRISLVYVETFRNIPLLLHILLIHGIVVNTMPHPRQALSFGEGFFLSNRGLKIPKPIFEQGSSLIFIAFVLAIVGIFVFRKYARKVQDQEGRVLPVFWISVGLILGLPLIAYFLAGQPISFEYPFFKGFNFKGGLKVLPEFIALLLALSLYTAAFIAENVRGGILAVSHGQTEAALSLGLRRQRTLQLVIIPQALRVIIPPLTSQYLNLTKNSSLAIAVGYMDLVATIGGISLNQTGRAFECMTIVLAIYLSISITISLLMNWYNKRIRLVER